MKLDFKVPIKNIIFDFGGVLLDLYIDRTYHELSNVLNTDFKLDTLPSDVVFILNEFEKGNMRYETFIWNLQRLHVKKTPQPRPIINAWNAMLGGWQQTKLDLLSSLKPHFNLFLLSNTNEIHLDWVYRDLKLNHNISEFESLFFTKAYYSHLIHKRKPDAEIFEYVLNDSRLKAEETLFIDDNEQNIHAAKMLGLQVVHHECNAPLDYLFELIN